MLKTSIEDKAAAAGGDVLICFQRRAALSEKGGVLSVSARSVRKAADERRLVVDDSFRFELDPQALSFRSWSKRSKRQHKAFYLNKVSTR